MRANSTTGNRQTDYCDCSYSAAFFAKGAATVKNFDKLLVRIERGEERRRESAALLVAAKEKIRNSHGSHESVRVDYSMGCRSTTDWGEEEDRFLLCWAAEHGVDDNVGLQLAMRTTPSMAFYHSMHTRTAVDFRRRTMALLRLMVKDNAGTLRTETYYRYYISCESFSLFDSLLLINAC